MDKVEKHVSVAFACDSPISSHIVSWTMLLRVAAQFAKSLHLIIMPWKSSNGLMILMSDAFWLQVLLGGSDRA